MKKKKLSKLNVNDFEYQLKKAITEGTEKENKRRNKIKNKGRYRVNGK